MNLTMDKFKQKRDDTYQKRCNECLEKFRKWAHENKCEHGRRKDSCKEPECISKATSICPHGRYKARCKEPECISNATALCSHGRRKDRCKEPECISNATAICPHGRFKATCKEPECISNATALCSHGRFKATCKEPECISNATALCDHQRQRHQCKDCTDPIHVTIKNMLHGSKQCDKKRNRYDANNFIDKCFLEQLIDDEGKHCCYCNIELQYIERNSTLATIERINNDIGHTKSNVKISCYKCNVSRVGQR
jgi:hypothetical protein